MSSDHAFSAPGAPPPPDRGLGPALAWGCYLGCSWTWVIGMFLPSILVRDYGWAGWALFAIPNVLGAAAMGFVLTAKSSKLFVDKHRTACVAFSHVTLLLQLFTLIWFSGVFAGGGAIVLSAGALALFFIALVALWRIDPTHQRHPVVLILAIGAACVSLGAMSYALQLDGAWFGVDPKQASTLTPPLLEGPGLIGLAGATIFGFGLSPYMDLTFHRARQQTDRPTGRAAFAFGFGCVFLAMIVFALAYAGIVAAYWKSDRAALPDLPSAWLVLLTVHVLLQVGVTVYFHVRELALRSPKATLDSSDPNNPAKPARPAIPTTAIVLALYLLVGVGALFVRHNAIQLPGHQGSLSLGEGVYRAFLMLYAVVFPAYVLLVAVPCRKTVTENARRAVFCIAGPVAYGLACASFIFGFGPLGFAAAGVLVAARAALDLGLGAQRPSSA
ncbi:MAG: hypothetical protein AAF288_10385 [Planctomycetota bacterium]